MDKMEQGTGVGGHRSQTDGMNANPDYAKIGSETEIRFEDFSGGHLNSLTWYDLLPGDPVEVTGVQDPRSSSDLAEALLAKTYPDDIHIVDALAAKLLNGCPAADTYGRWHELAFRLSQAMSSNLSATGSRPLRMRAQRLNYYLQAVMARALEDKDGDIVLADSLLTGSKPWDYFRDGEEAWWLTSDQYNIHRLRPGLEQQNWRLGLPTQIDALPDGTLAFGSLYTLGAMLHKGGGWEPIGHDMPVVLVFLHEGKRILLDHAGQVWADSPRRLLTQIPRPQVHFARFFDGVVYCLDNMDFGHVTVYDMSSGKTARHNIFPVQVCNDIAVVGDVRYLIDKQQGSVFKFDLDWHFQRRVLRFGRGPGCLLDPVSLRHHAGRLLVVSWLSGRLIELKTF